MNAAISHNSHLPERAPHTDSTGIYVHVVIEFIKETWLGISSLRTCLIEAELNKRLGHKPLERNTGPGLYLDKYGILP